MKSAILSKPLPYLALLIAHIIWGLNFVVAKITLDEFPPSSLGFLRFALAALLLAPFFLAHTKHGLPKNLKIKVDSKDLPRLVGVGIFMITLNIGFFFEGIKRTSAINASALTLAIPIFSVLAGWFFLKEKVYLFNILGIVAGMAGALVIIGIPQLFVGSFDGEAVLGNIFIILCSICWVVGAILSRQALKKYPSLIVTSVAFLVGVITFFGPAAWEYVNNPGWPERVTGLGLIGLTFMTLLTSISAYFLFEWGLARTSIAAADLFTYIEPLVASTAAVFILGERISYSFIVGVALIALGVIWGTYAKEEHHRHHKAHRV